MLMFLFLLLFLLRPAYSEYFGVRLDDLKNERIALKSQVFIANSSALFLKDFHVDSANGILFYFATEAESKSPRNVLEILPSPGGDFMKKRDHSIEGRFESNKLIVVSPKKVNSWQVFGVSDLRTKEKLAEVKIDKWAPSAFCCIKLDDTNMAIENGEYGASSGPIEVLDHKTLRLNNFSIDATKPPDAWIYLGFGQINQNSGEKALVVGRDTNWRHCAIHEDLKNRRVEIRLNGNQTVYDVNYLSIFCYQYSVDFGSIRFKIDPDGVPVPFHMPQISDHGFPSDPPPVDC